MPAPTLLTARTTGRPIADLDDLPGGPFDPEDLVESEEEAPRYEEDDLGPRMIEQPLAEEEPTAEEEPGLVRLRASSHRAR